MSTYRFAGLLGAGGALLSSVAHAQCTKDTDCKGNRICEAGVCATDPARVVAPEASAAPPAPSTPAGGERHSKGMMVGGIVMVSLAPIALITSSFIYVDKMTCEASDPYGISLDDCDGHDPAIYGSLIAAGALTAIGIPLIVIGAKREPVSTATLTPWATPHGAGLGLRVEL